MCAQKASSLSDSKSARRITITAPAVKRCRFISVYQILTTHKKKHHHHPPPPKKMSGNLFFKRTPEHGDTLLQIEQAHSKYQRTMSLDELLTRAYETSGSHLDAVVVYLMPKVENDIARSVWRADGVSNRAAIRLANRIESMRLIAKGVPGRYPPGIPQPIDSVPAPIVGLRSQDLFTNITRLYIQPGTSKRQNFVGEELFAPGLNLPASLQFLEIAIDTWYVTGTTEERFSIDRHLEPVRRSGVKTLHLHGYEFSLSHLFFRDAPVSATLQEFSFNGSLVFEQPADVTALAPLVNLTHLTIVSPDDSANILLDHILSWSKLELVNVPDAIIGIESVRDLTPNQTVLVALDTHPTSRWWSQIIQRRPRVATKVNFSRARLALPLQFRNFRAVHLPLTDSQNERIVAKIGSRSMAKPVPKLVRLLEHVGLSRAEIDLLVEQVFRRWARRSVLRGLVDLK